MMKDKMVKDKKMRGVYHTNMNKREGRWATLRYYPIEPAGGQHLSNKKSFLGWWGREWTRQQCPHQVTEMCEIGSGGKRRQHPLTTSDGIRHKLREKSVTSCVTRSLLIRKGVHCSLCLWKRNLTMPSFKSQKYTDLIGLKLCWEFLYGFSRIKSEISELKKIANCSNTWKLNSRTILKWKRNQLSENIESLEYMYQELCKTFAKCWGGIV